MTTHRPKVLFLCTGNSCRSQMAEGWARHLHGGSVEVDSAGTEPRDLNPKAVAAMAEAGVDISGHASKSIAAVESEDFDLVITVCDEASAACPAFPGAAKVIHRGFDDPPRLERGASSKEEAMGHYRRVRDEIRAFIERLPEMISREIAAEKREGRLS